MGTFRFVSVAFALFIVAYFGIRHLTAVQPLKPDARVPTFHKVDVNSPRFKMEQSFASDNDATRDKLRQAVLESAKALGFSLPMGRLGKPEDIARVALFLASDQSAWVTGERISASGGQR